MEICIIGLLILTYLRLAESSVSLYLSFCLEDMGWLKNYFLKEKIHVPYAINSHFSHLQVIHQSNIYFVWIFFSTHFAVQSVFFFFTIAINSLWRVFLTPHFVHMDVGKLGLPHFYAYGCWETWSVNKTYGLLYYRKTETEAPFSFFPVRS